ncbi:hypothetical protein EVAR_91432_1 [Eumeta japonica]|uniref:Uncharacterized protein n=1 Tax=Eumeta variegata TaxID=151549 RepID=A0A4C1X131_EUMVA|nr:hypothetical protein EVAR_91432_1 [Eumeta japonica]
MFQKPDNEYLTRAAPVVCLRFGSGVQLPPRVTVSISKIILARISDFICYRRKEKVASDKRLHPRGADVKCKRAPSLSPEEGA